MKFTTFTSALALTSSAVAAPSIAIEKRNPSGSFELVAYGVANGAIRMFYSDGMSLSPPTTKTKSNIDPQASRTPATPPSGHMEA
jgi:hypothetical protein